MVGWSAMPAVIRRLSRRWASAALLSAALLVSLAVAAAPARALAPPRLDVRAAALLDADDGQLLWGDRANQPVAIASTTKLMTALITLEHTSLHAVFPEPDYYPAPADSQIGLVPGERMTVHDLLLALLLPSADDAAEDLAFNVGGGSVGRFIAMMNARARQLGLTGTHYSTPIGLDTPGNYSTARDLVKLARYVMATQPFFRQAVALTHATLRSGNHPRAIINRNDLVARFGWINGVKTGHTNQAGYVLVASARRDGLNMISVVLGTPSAAVRDDTTLALLNWGFAGFHRVTAVHAGDVVAHLKLHDRTGAPAAVIAGGTYTRVLARDAHVATRVRLVAKLAGPLAFHTRMGTLRVIVDGTVVARIPLLLAHAVPAPPAPLLNQLAGPITLVCAVLLVGVAATAAALGRRRGQPGAAHGRRRR